MKVNIEVQFLCTDALRGIPYYILNLTEYLVQREKNSYELSFFDYQKERENYTKLKKHLNRNTLEKVSVRECNELSYNTIMQGNVSRDASEYDAKSYAEWMDSEADLYHFTQSMYLPHNITSKAVVTIHDVIPLLPTAGKYCLEHVIAAFKNNIKYLEENDAIQIISDSQSTKEDLIKYTNIEAERIYVVPLAYDYEKNYPEKNKKILQELGITKKYLLYLGAVEYRKGIVDILEAYKKVKADYKDVKLVLAGSVAKELVPVIESYKGDGLAEDILLPGFVSDDQKRVLLSSAETFLFPSEYEGFGLPVLEAMACGAPVITTNVSSLPEVGGDAVMYVSPKQPEELAEAIEKMLSSEDIRQDYIERGFKQCEKFSWDKTAELTEAVYKNVYEAN